MMKQFEAVKVMQKYKWDFFATIAFSNRPSIINIEGKMDNLGNHYLIERFFWFPQRSPTTGTLHVHSVLKTHDILKALTTSKIRDELPTGWLSKRNLNGMNELMEAQNDLSKDGFGKIRTGRLYNVFKTYGEVDFRLFDRKQSGRCFEYITREIEWNGLPFGFHYDEPRSFVSKIKARTSGL